MHDTNSCHVPIYDDVLISSNKSTSSSDHFQNYLNPMEICKLFIETLSYAIAVFMLIVLTFIVIYRSSFLNWIRH